MDPMDRLLGDPPATAGAPKPSRFAPKLKGKKIAPALPKPEPIDIDPPPNPNPAIQNFKPEPDPITDGKSAAAAAAVDSVVDEPMQLDASNGVAVDDGAIEKEIEDDVVIQEIDLFINRSPLDDGASFYVMQYPLRPSWRPYELDERCQEVRVRPKELRVEVDLSLDVDGENCDQTVSALQKLTLSSSRPIYCSNFAVGIRKGNQMHLSPVDAAVQLRPSITCLNNKGKRRQYDSPSIFADIKPSEAKAVPGDSSENLDDAEPWVPLEYHSSDSSFWDKYQNKMVAEKSNEIPSAVKQFDYINCLFPGTSSDKKGAVGPSRKALLLMPLEERLKKWLSEGSQVNRFAYILHLASTDSIEDVLKVLQQYAYLVQGLWVTKSSLLYEGFLARARDYILSQFSNNCVIRYEKKNPPPPFIRKILVGQLAVERLKLYDWKFKEPADLSFIKSYPNIVKEQERAWSDRVKQIMGSLQGAVRTGENKDMHALIRTLNPSHLVKKTFDSGKADNAQKSDANKISSSVDITMSNGDQKDLVKALLEIFHLRSVRSLNSIIKDLNGRVNGLTPELQSGLSAVAVNIHGVYILNTLKNPAVDPLRNFVIDIFRKKKANAKYREQDVRKISEAVLKRKIPDSEFNEVVNELCISKGGLSLKSGD